MKKKNPQIHVTIPIELAKKLEEIGVNRTNQSKFFQFSAQVMIFNLEGKSKEAEAYINFLKIELNKGA